MINSQAKLVDEMVDALGGDDWDFSHMEGWVEPRKQMGQRKKTPKKPKQESKQEAKKEPKSAQ